MSNINNIISSSNNNSSSSSSSHLLMNNHLNNSSSNAKYLLRHFGIYSNKIFVKSTESDKENIVYDIQDIGEIQVNREPIPKIGSNDVLLNITSVAISGSDLHLYESGRKICPNTIVGQDATGIVCEVGKNVHDLCSGDRVVMESGLSCGLCHMCKKGHSCQCERMIYKGFLRRYQVHPSKLCHKLPNDVTSKEATLTSTLAIGLQACRRANIGPSNNVLIIGSNPTAIAAALCARIMGAQKVIMTAIAPKELQWIKRIYCFDNVPINRSIQCNQMLEQVFDKFCAWPDVVINCAVSEDTMNFSIMALQPCGQCILAHCDSEFASFNALGLLMKNISITPCHRSTNMFPAAIQLFSTGNAPMRYIIARTFPWDKVNTAFREALNLSSNGHWRVAIDNDRSVEC